MSLSDGLSYASIATYSCSSGYKVVGSPTRTCQADGSWDVSEPSCEPVGECLYSCSASFGLVENDDTKGHRIYHNFRKR